MIAVLARFTGSSGLMFAGAQLIAKATDGGGGGDGLVLIASAMITSASGVAIAWITTSRRRPRWRDDDDDDDSITLSRDDFEKLMQRPKKPPVRHDR